MKRGREAAGCSSGLWKEEVASVTGSADLAVDVSSSGSCSCFCVREEEDHEEYAFKRLDFVNKNGGYFPPQNVHCGPSSF